MAHFLCNGHGKIAKFDVVWWGGVGCGAITAESLAAVTKSQLRRHGLQKVVNDPIEHRNILGVHYLKKKPGLESVVKALARFRLLAMKSCRTPTLVFKEAPWDA